MENKTFQICQGLYLKQILHEITSFQTLQYPEKV